jgi:hypothetical protein
MKKCENYELGIHVCSDRRESVVIQKGKKNKEVYWRKLGSRGILQRANSSQTFGY